MSELSCNQCATPDSNRDAAENAVRFWPLWVWLVIALVTSWFGTPADPYSMLVALAYGLVCFWVGVVLAAGRCLVLRIMPLVLFVAAAVSLLIAAGWDFNLGVMLCYGVVSIVCGAWGYRVIHDRPLRILPGFSVGFALGRVAAPPGPVLSALLGIWLARLFPRRREPVGQRP